MKRRFIFWAVAWIFATGLMACKKTDNWNGNTEETGFEEAGQQAAGRADEETAQEGKRTEEMTPEEKLLAEQKELYACYIEKLEQLLSEGGGQETGDGLYQETIGSIYLYSGAYSGGLQADEREDGSMTFWMVVEDDNTEEKQRFHCRLLTDGSLWFTYQAENEGAKDLPGYIVNEDVLRYGKADFVYDDGQTDIEEKRRLRRQELEQYMGEEVKGEVQEFWCCQEHVYKIDREAETFADVTEEKEGCIAYFLEGQPNRIRCQSKVSEAVLGEVEKYKPEGYSLLWGKNAWSETGVCDLNHDGKMDYVAVLYPDDYEEVRKYADDSPYENSPQYYAAGFWLLLSDEKGEYEQIQLSGSIEYWEDALDLVEVGFVDEGVLQLEYFVGRSPFSNAQLQFQYDEEEKNFYILSSYYRDGYDDALLIGDRDNYGRTSMSSYFAWPQHYCEGVWESVDEVAMQDGSRLGYYSDSFQYRCENLLEERHINSLIWEKEYGLFLAMKEYYSGMELNFHMVADPVFYNHKLVSGHVELYGHAGEDYDFTVWMPVMADKQKGEYVTVTGLLEKESFIRIFEDWSENELSHGRMETEEKERYRKAIEECWEKADLTENYLGNKEEVLFLQMVQEGVRIGIWSETGKWMQYSIIDKEYFLGTKIWDYLAPVF
ncbi:MAG TPA: hypothetical protein DCZ40_10695 [Lachnospiraceae bacterium]|nr:hypothetical protein [Lachnospiraceae bacterium]